MLAPEAACAMDCEVAEAMDWPVTAWALLLCTPVAVAWALEAEGAKAAGEGVWGGARGLALENAAFKIGLENAAWLCHFLFRPVGEPSTLMRRARIRSINPDTLNRSKVALQSGLFRSS